MLIELAFIGVILMIAYSEGLQHKENKDELDPILTVIILLLIVLCIHVFFFNEN